MSLSSLTDKSIIIQKLTTGGSDGMGGRTAGSWVTWLSGVKARIQPLSGEERVIYNQMNMRITHKIYIQPITGSDITGRNRITYGSKTYTIQTVRDIDEQARLITIEAEETKS